MEDDATRMARLREEYLKEAHPTMLQRVVNYCKEVWDGDAATQERLQIEREEKSAEDRRTKQENDPLHDAKALVRGRGQTEGTVAVEVGDTHNEDDFYFEFVSESVTESDNPDAGGGSDDNNNHNKYPANAEGQLVVSNPLNRLDRSAWEYSSDEDREREEELFGPATSERTNYFRHHRLPKSAAVSAPDALNNTSKAENTQRRRRKVIQRRRRAHASTIVEEDPTSTEGPSATAPSSSRVRSFWDIIIRTINGDVRDLWQAPENTDEQWRDVVDGDMRLFSLLDDDVRTLYVANRADIEILNAVIEEKSRRISSLSNALSERQDRHEKMLAMRDALQGSGTARVLSQAVEQYLEQTEKEKSGESKRFVETGAFSN
eukprot:TRINITY_DN17042_c0_g1_i2.p1 TRINITY_DN17042_c0_g1~~TRINITY_DN17042_c0_g1_i2.p1  ORF type:complete len:376 (+),score=42.32 TRINITY_DN17042_c0_g1_i2:266-1393(+)